MDSHAMHSFLFFYFSHCKGGRKLLHLNDVIVTIQLIVHPLMNPKVFAEPFCFILFCLNDVSYDKKSNFVKT